MVLRVNPEKKEERERVASALLRATLGLAAAHGFSSLGLREVARAADIAPTSFYRHFTDMEALGLTLIEDLVGPFVAGWVERAKTTRSPADLHVAAIAREALTSITADPELVRFILAERVGAVASFRTALRKKLDVLSSGLTDALAADLGADANAVPVSLVQAGLALVLDGCAEALDTVHTPTALEGRITEQLRVLLAGARRQR